MKGIELDVFVYDQEEMRLVELDLSLEEKDLHESETIKYFFTRIDFFHRHREYPVDFCVVYSGNESMCVKITYEELKKIIQDGTS